MRWAFTGLLALALAAAIVEALQGAGGGDGQRRAAPALPAQVLAGSPTTLASLRGRPAFINFWASWCGPCTRETPQLNRFARLVGDRAAVVGIDWSDSAANARRFIRRFHLSYPILRDPDDRTGGRFGLSGLPTTYVLDSRGRIVETLYGPQNLRTLGRALKTAQS
jgi:thiol-disulfide isomerase/thioredoxin